MSSSLASSYELINDINCDVTPYNSGAGFAPVGGVFNGNLNGNNFSILQLYMSNPVSASDGLFSETNTANIKFITFKNVNLTFNSPGGVVSGSDYGSNFSNLLITGSIYGNNLNNIGGVTSYLEEGKIDNVFVNVNFTITGTSSSNLGGLVGYVALNSKIDNSMVTGKIIGDDNVGGLVGYMYYGSAGIDNSYSNADITGTNLVGGLAGNSYELSLIKNSFFVGNVTGSGPSVGSIFGYGSNGVVVNSFWNNHTNNPNISLGSDSSVDMNPIQDNISYFYDSSNQPLSVWNSSLWEFSGSTLPTLKSFPIGPASVPGICGISNNLCSQGNLNNTADNSTHYLWDCDGFNGGTTISCNQLISQSPNVSSSITLPSIGFFSALVSIVSIFSFLLF